MLILTTGSPISVHALASRIARAGGRFLDVRGLGLSPAAVRAHLGAADDGASRGAGDDGAALDAVWLLTVPPGQDPAIFGALVRRPGERVALATRLNAGDLGTLVADAEAVMPAELPVPSIATERLVMTVPNEAQIDGYYRDIVDSTIFDTLIWDGPSGPSELHDYWHRNVQEMQDGPEEALSLAVIERASDRYIGGVALRPVGRNPEQLDIGYAFAPHAHGQGYATEAVAALVDEGFAKRGAERIIATVFVGNDASRHVAEKVGFVCEGVLRAAVRKRGRMLDKWMMAMVRADWEARQG